MNRRDVIDGLQVPTQLYVDGQLVDGDGVYETTDPGTGETLAKAPRAGRSHLENAVRAARDAFPAWSSLPPTQRAGHLRAIADALEGEQDELAHMEVLDNGKPLGEAAAVDIPLTVEIFRYYAGWVTKLEGRQLPNSIPSMHSFLRRDPVGVVAAITPWNFPLLELTYKVAPALAAGCTVVARPAPETPLTALRLGELLHGIGLPPGVVNIVTEPGTEVSAGLVGHDGVDLVAFTGRTETGRTILQTAGEDLRPVALQLSAKSPNIVLPDADLDAAVTGAAGGMFFNQGQACVAGSRLFLHRSIADDFLERLVARAEQIQLGHGLDEGTEMGPLISGAHRETVLGYVDRAVGDGASLLTGGEPPDDPALEGGFFLRPTILTGVRNDMECAREEIFGPVLTVLRWDEVDEVVRLANDNPYGLAAGVWTADAARGLSIADAIDAGTVWINTYGMFDVSVPFGGRKMSGYGGGRELGEEALRTYLKPKSVWLDLEGRVMDSGQSVG